MFDYDVMVIGGGPGGYVAAIKSAQAGKKTCLVERGRLGGVCLNIGCMPTKTLVRSAEVLATVRRAAEFGIAGADLATVRPDMPKVMQRKQTVVDRLVTGVTALMRKNGVDVVNASASFCDDHTIEADGRRITAQYFVIATGAENFVPSSIQISSSPDAVSSTELLETEDLPQDIIIVGGGVIGIEFAFIYNAFGVRTTVLELMDEILPGVDRDVARAARQQMMKNGVKFVLGAQVTSVNGGQVEYVRNGEAQSVQASKSLLALGRRPLTAGLNAQSIGIVFDKAAIGTNAQHQTNIPHVFAVGDVTGRSMLAHAASRQAVEAIAVIAGSPETYTASAIPACIYTVPEIASVGLTEEQAKERFGADGVSVGKFQLMANGRAGVEGENRGVVKIIVGREKDEILGAHLYGPHAGEMIAEFVTAINAGLTAERLIASVRPHPSINEACGEALLLARIGKAIHC